MWSEEKGNEIKIFLGGKKIPQKAVKAGTKRVSEKC